MTAFMDTWLLEYHQLSQKMMVIRKEKKRQKKKSKKSNLWSRKRNLLWEFELLNL